MNKEERNILIGAVGVAAFFTILYYRRKKKKVRAKNIQSATVDDNIENIEKTNDSLSFGSKGKDVKAVQMYMNTACSSELKKNNLYPLELNGIWDEETEKATVYCSALQRNTIDSSTLNMIKRDLKNSKID